MKNSKFKIKNVRRAGVLGGLLAILFLCIFNCSGQLTTTTFSRSILTNSTAGQTRTNLGAISVLDLTNASTLYVRKDGNNANALKGNIGRAYASVSNALFSVGNNENVVIGPGDYGGHFAQQVMTGSGRTEFNIFNKTNLHIRGAGNGTTLTFTNRGACFYISNCNNVVLSDFSLIGVAPSATGLVFTTLWGAITLENCTNIVFERLYLKDHEDQGIFHAITPNFSYDCVVRNCTFINLGSWGQVANRYDGAAVVSGPGWTMEGCETYDCARGTEPFAAYGGFRSIRIKNNKFINCLDQAIAFGGQSTGTNSYGWITDGEISGNYIVYEPGHTRLGSNAVISAAGPAAIYIHSASNIVCRANYISGAPYYGIEVHTSSGSNMNHIVIDGNTIVGAKRNGIAMLADAGLSVNNSAIRNNYIYDSAYVAIEMYRCTNAIIENNFINNWSIDAPNTQNAMEFQIASNLFICGNTIYDGQATHTGAVGISLASTVKNVCMAGNIIQGQIGAAIVNNAGAELLYDDYARTLGTLPTNSVPFYSNGVLRGSSALVFTNGPGPSLLKVGVSGVSGNRFELATTAAVGPTNNYSFETFEPFAGDNTLWWGYNHSLGNRQNTNDIMWAMGLETSYGGSSEWYLTQVSSNGLNHRPMQINTDRATGLISTINFAGYNFQIWNQTAFDNQTTPFMYVDPINSRLGLGVGASPLYQLHIASTNISTFAMRSLGTNATDNARILLWNGSATGGDPFINFILQGEADEYSLGADTSDSNKFKLSKSGTLGTTDLLTVTTTGNVGIGNNAPVGKLEVSGTPNSYLLRVNTNTLVVTNGNVGIGTTAPLTKLTVADTSTSSPRGILSQQFSDTTDGARIGHSKARGTVASPTIVQTGDTLGRDIFRGYDGANYLEMASIEIGVSGTVASTRVPTFMAFSTANDVAPSVLTERMRIDNAGNVGIGTATPSQKLDVAGNAIFSGKVTATNGFASYATNTFSSTNDAGYTNTSGVNMFFNLSSTPSAGYIFYNRSGTNGSIVCGTMLFTNTFGSVGVTIAVPVNCGFQIVGSGLSVLMNGYAQ